MSNYDFAFIDSETRSLLDVTQTGAYKYAAHPSTEGTVWGYVFDNEHGAVWSPSWAWGNTRHSRPDAAHPDELLDHVAEGGYVVAWNAFFDRHIWNEVMVKKYGWPVLPVEQVFCAQAQAEANNLPGKLGKACEALGTYFKKDPKGKSLINLLADGTRDNWESERFETPENMGHFRSYCLKDCLSMRDVWQYTRPLTMREWEEYHASEHINDRGVGVDIDFATAAMNYAQDESEDINVEMAEVTGDPRITITHHLRKAQHLHEQLWPSEELQEIVSRPAKDDGKERFSCDRPTREIILDLMLQEEFEELFEPEHADRIIRFLELIEAGNSAAVRKFTAIVNQECGDRVHGGYSFNGAGQTGRYSSRGIQRHNMIRDPVEKGNPDRAIDAIEDIMAGRDKFYLQEKYKFSVSRLLARLIRPTFVAGEGKMLVWSDWDQIEGRCLPWLSMSRGGDMKLDLYRSGIDVYSVTASKIVRCPVEDVTDAQRQAMGKVPELALGFGGAAGAFKAMARNYGVSLPDAQVKQIVTDWRTENAWCTQFWYDIWDAAMAAFKHPGEWFKVGRVAYLFHPQLMHGTLICQLPCGRWLVYPQFRHERVCYVAQKTTKRHKKGDTVDEWRTSFVKGFGGGYGRVDLWYGILAENITQGIAASFLRDALVELQDIAVLHTHDEIVVEVDEDKVDEVSGRLKETMEFIPDWGDGLPLTVSVEHGPFYTK